MELTDDIEDRTRGIANTEEFADRFDELVDLEASFEDFEEQLEILEHEFIDNNSTLPVETIPQPVEDLVRVVFQNEVTTQYRDKLIQKAVEDEDVDVPKELENTDK